MGMVRRAAVAGSFYPSQQEELSRVIGNFLLESCQQVKLPRPPKALIVPHAGYVYSGPVAASAYSWIRPLHAEISKVVLLGPVHRVPIQGLALPGGEAFATPLGTVALDVPACRQLESLPQVSVNAAAHALEHSLEVQLPFLQTVLGSGFTLVPLAVGQADPQQVAQVLERLWGWEDTLIVISSDLSHFLPYSTAQQVDSNTCRHILQLDTHINPEQACGAYPINGLLLAARRRGLTPALLGLCNSGDTAGDKNRVVGYAAFSFTEAGHHA